MVLNFVKYYIWLMFVDCKFNLVYPSFSRFSYLFQFYAVSTKPSSTLSTRNQNIELLNDGTKHLQVTKLYNNITKLSFYGLANSSIVRRNSTPRFVLTK